ncbi:MAG: aminotransferase class I/II-fold pyridoxal phosphate-dependent enzyme [Byssovorax sp.]
METSDAIKTIETLHRDARARGLFFQQATDAELRGRRVTVGGQEMLSFGSCSYLGLEMDPRLIEGACDAARRFGTQFSCSRGYLSAPPYEELEASLDAIFGGPALVAPTTTLAHQAAFDALISEKDAVVVDHQAHQSIHQAANLARTRGAHVELCRHEELEKAEEQIRALSIRYRTVWFATDGVMSMYGDLAPFGLLRRLLDVADNVRLYVDDAHGMSWDGEHGRGSFLRRMPISPRIVLGTSLAKAFGCGGAALVFSDPEERDRVRMCGGSLLFGGPMQPPMLGAALACAKIHLSPEIDALQATLRERVRFTNRRFREAGLPLLVDNDVPIRFVRLGLPKVAAEVATRMARDGIYVNISMFPTVPMRRAGVRIAVNANHTPEDIERMTASLARHVPAVLAEEGVSRERIDELFARAVVGERRSMRPPPGAQVIALRASVRPAPITPAAPVLRVEHARSIDEIDPAEWDGMLGTVGTCSHASMVAVEALYRRGLRPEHAWEFDYVIVRDAAGRPIAATHFTTSLQKDDFLMREEVSRAVELRRREDPYLLCSRVVMCGSTFSEGNHLYLDRSGPWREALAAVLDVAHAIYEREKADSIVVRDLPAMDTPLDAEMLAAGYVSMAGLPSHVLPVDFEDEAELCQRLSKRKRQYLREQITRASLFDVRAHGVGASDHLPLDRAEAEHLYGLYANVARKKLRINVFDLPQGFLSAIAASPAWEIVSLRLPESAGGPAHGRPVAFFAAHVHGGHYAAFLCGLDYDYVIDHGAYRQALFQMIRRARLRGARFVHLGMDADVEKSRYGTTVNNNVIYAQVREHDNAALLRDIVAEVGVACERHPSRAAA